MIIMVNNGKCIYKIKDGKVYIKSYYKGKLLFEGEYLNGIKNGKGKEYYDGALSFEGQFLNGRKNGKGKSYYWNGGFPLKENI